MEVTRRSQQSLDRLFEPLSIKNLALAGLFAATLIGAPINSEAIPITNGSAVFDNNAGLYTYTYTVSDVDPGRKVTGIAWVVIEGAGAPQPAYLPLSWNVPYFWNFLPGHDGPVPGGVWMSNAGTNDGGSTFPLDPTWGILLAGQTRTFSFTTGYAPREGTYFLVENADGSEINYNFLTGTTVVPNYDGSLVETLWQGQNTLNPISSVPEPSTLSLLFGALAMSGFFHVIRLRIRKRKQSVVLSHL